MIAVGRCSVPVLLVLVMSVAAFGQDNIEAILSRITDLENLRKAQANSNMGVDAANRLYEKHLEQLRKNLIQLGYNTTAVNAIIDRYKAIPKTVETNLKLVITTHGDVTAWSMIRSQERQQEEASGKRAAGGPVQKGKAYWVGENGPELVTFNENGTVHSAADSKAMMAGGPGRARGRPAPAGTDRHRERDRVCPAAVQRRGDALQHGADAVPHQPRRRAGQGGTRGALGDRGPGRARRAACGPLARRAGRGLSSRFTARRE